MFFFLKIVIYKICCAVFFFFLFFHIFFVDVNVWINTRRNVVQSSTSGANSSQPQPSTTVPTIVPATENVIDLTASTSALTSALTSAPPPSQTDYQKLANALSFAYVTFIKMSTEERQLNNLGRGWGLTIGSTQHRRVMTMIDRHFLDVSSSRLVDPEIVRYIGEVDTSKINNVDRVRMELVKIETERNRHQIQRDRRQRLRSKMTKHATCPICLENVSPQMGLVHPDCGHVLCASCMDRTFESPDTANACCNCRKLLANRDDFFNVNFQFNEHHDAICRFCEGPFELDPDDNNSCYVITCGHAYHKRCLSNNRVNCLACTAYMSTPAKKIFLNF